MDDDPTLTLRQGLERYALANEGLLTTREMSEEADEFFRWPVPSACSGSAPGDT